MRSSKDALDLNNILLETHLEASLSLFPMCHGNVLAAFLVKNYITRDRSSLQFHREEGWQPGKEPWPEEVLKKDKDEADALSALLKIEEARRDRYESCKRH